MDATRTPAARHCPGTPADAPTREPMRPHRRPRRFRRHEIRHPHR